MTTAALFVLIPAAGAARRMRGADKLLEPVGGVAQLRRIAAAALAVSPSVIVTLRPTDDARRGVLAGLELQLLTVPDAAEGLASSIRAGVSAATAGGAAALMILPADMPELGADDLRRVAEAFAGTPEAILRATAEDGTPGHPVVFPADLFPALAALAGDQGARELIARETHRLRPVPLPGRRATVDLDTPEDWSAWRAGRGDGA